MNSPNHNSLKIIEMKALVYLVETYGFDLVIRTLLWLRDRRYTP